MPVANPHSFTNYTIEELVDYSVQAFDSLGKHDVPEGIIPSRSSKKDQGTFRVYDTGAFKSNLFAALGDNQVAPSATWGHSTLPYIITPSGLRDRISDRDLVNEEESLDLFKDTSLFLARNAVKNRNAAFAAAFLTPGEWTTDITGVAAPAGGDYDGIIDPVLLQFEQFDQATSDPLAIIDALMETMQSTTELRPDTFIIPRRVMTQLKRNPQINQFGLQNPSNGIAGGQEYTVNVIAQYTGLEASRIHVIDTVINNQVATTNDATLAELENGNTGKKIVQGAEVMEWLVEKNCLLMHVGDTNLGLRSMSACAEFIWTGLYPSNERGNFKIKTRYDQDGEFTWVEARHAFKYQIVAPALGILLVDCIA
jgi:hypothetical protein